MPKNDFRALRAKLLENSEWPLMYMFKFIVPNRDRKVEKLTSILPQSGEISYRHTKNLRHISVTCVVAMASADDIITIMENAMLIEDIMCL